MGHLPLPASSGAGVLNLSVPPPGRDQSPESFEALANVALLEVLREAVTTGTISTDSILNALADTARVLSGADGTAVASRKDGLIVCRARSGEIAPDLGAPVKAESGISGECLRTATVQICHDTLRDGRVDAEACRSLGIRSVAVVPLRGRAGIFGILEAFSAQPNAFTMENIDSLRALAEIVELAYSHEEQVLHSVPTTPAMRRPAIFAPPAAGNHRPEQVPTKRYWILGGIAVGLVLTAAVVRLSWRQTSAEIAESVIRAQPASTSEARPVDYHPTAASLKPNTAIPAHPADKRQTRSGIENAAGVEPLEDGSQPLTPARTSLPSISPNPPTLSGTSVSGDEPPPPVQIAVGNPAEAVPKLASSIAPRPEFGGAISRGVTEPTLIRQVEPIYPVEARTHGIAGAVVLDAAIAQDGSIQKIQIVSGAPPLASAAKAAVQQWRYKPALLNGKAVEVEKRITIVFNR